MNILNPIWAWVIDEPDRIAVRTQQVSLTFARLGEAILQYAEYFKQSGIIEREIVALQVDSELPHLLCSLALTFLGAGQYTVSSGTATHNARAGSLLGIKKSIVMNADSPSIAEIRIPLNRMPSTLRAGSVCAMPNAGSANFPWLALSSSGTTGIPKIFTLSHEQGILRRDTYLTAINVGEDDCFLSLTQVQFAAAKQRMYYALSRGSSIAFASEFSLDKLGEFIRDNSVTNLFCVAMHLDLMVEAAKKIDPAATSPIFPTVRQLETTSSMVSTKLKAEVEKFLSPNLIIEYAVSETGLISATVAEDKSDEEHSVGFPLPGVIVEIVGADHCPLPAGKAGIIRVKCRGMLGSYLTEEGIRSALDEGWFYPGDIGLVSECGRLIFLGRADDMMIFNGINIYPAEIEGVLALHPSVKEVAAFPLHSRRHQDIPAAAIIPRGHVEMKELEAYCLEHLGSHRPQFIFLQESFPRNQIGKVLRNDLASTCALKLKERSEVSGNLTKSTPPSLARHPAYCRPVRRLMIRFACPPSIDLARIDDWLVSVLKINPEPQRGKVWQPDAASALHVVNLVQRVLFLNSEFLQLGRIPVFDPGHVINAEADKQAPTLWAVTVSVTSVAQISIKPYTLAINWALKTILWCARTPITPDNVAHLYKTIEQEVRSHLSKLVPAGKSTIPVLRAAHRLDIPFTHLGGGVYQFGWGSKSRLMDRSSSEKDSFIGSKLSHSKVLAAHLIRTAGLPAPEHGVAAMAKDARQIAQKLGWPVVVKPADRDRGEGVTVGVTNDSQLEAAFDFAIKLSMGKQVIVEREVPGICHRLFIADGRLLYAVKRWPKSVMGDGMKSVLELVDEANDSEDRSPPWLQTERFPKDEPAIRAMMEAGHWLHSIPSTGEWVPLRNIESTEWGGRDEDVTRTVHPDNIAIALRAAALFRLNTVGVDIISPDIGVAWHKNGAIINEVNFAPLFGVGEISRNYVTTYFAHFLDRDGRIPVIAVVGGQMAFDAGSAKQQELAGSGTKCFLTSHQITLAPNGEQIIYPFEGLFKRCQALLTNLQVEAIVLVVQTDELLENALPVDRLSEILTTSDPLTAIADPGRLVSTQRAATLLSVLRSCEASPVAPPTLLAKETTAPPILGQ